MNMDDLTTTYRTAANRLLLLDYDGTLADIAPTPPEAAPTPKILRVLKELTSDPRNTVVIISGRDRDTLDAWLGGLPLAFTAEHGLVHRTATGSWDAPEVDGSWKPAVRQILEAHAKAMRGTLVEEGPAALAWHYRTAENPDQTEQALAELKAQLQPIAAKAKLQLVSGKMVLEIRGIGVNKGVGVAKWLGDTKWDFILAAGDDTTDEDIFAAVPGDAFTIKIGEGATRARLHLNNSAAFLELLTDLSKEPTQNR